MKSEEHYVSFAERRRLRRVQEANERRDRQLGSRYSVSSLSSSPSRAPPALYYTPDRAAASPLSPSPKDHRRGRHSPARHLHESHLMEEQYHQQLEQPQQHDHHRVEHAHAQRPVSPTPTKAVSFIDHSPAPVTTIAARHTHVRHSPATHTKSLFQDPERAAAVAEPRPAHTDPPHAAREAVEEQDAASPPQRGRTKSPQRPSLERQGRARTPPLSRPSPSEGRRTASAKRKTQPLAVAPSRPLLPSPPPARERRTSFMDSITPRMAAPQPHPHAATAASSQPSHSRRSSRGARSLTSAPSPTRRSAPSAAAASTAAADLPSVSSPIAHALQSQWVLLQQQLCAPPGAYPTLSAAEQEKSLLLVLSRLPEEVETLLRDAGSCLPYLFAFAVAPVPTRRTQAVAMAALQAAVTSMCATWPTEATTSFLEEFFLGSHRALQALEAALGSLVASADARTEAEVAEGIEARSIQSLRACSLDLLALVVRRSAAVATTLLTRPAYLHMLLELLPRADEASDHEVCCIAAILHHCLCTVQDAAEVLVAYHAHHEVLRALQLALTLSYSGTGELQAHSSVTAVCTLVQVLILLTPCRAAFALLYSEDRLCVLLRELLTMPWGDVVELACLWLHKLLECQPTEEGPVLVRHLLHRVELAPILANTFLWKDRVPQGLAAAMCWRQMMLCEPAAAGAALAQDAGTIMAFLHVVLTYPVEALALAPAASSEEVSVQASMLVLEVLHTFALCEALSTPEVRACLRLLLQDQLSPTTVKQIRSNIAASLRIVGETYYTSYPVVAIERDRLPPSRGNGERSASGYSSSSDDFDHENDATDSEQAKGKGEEGEEIIYTSAQWRRLVRRALYALFPPPQRATAAAASSSRLAEAERSKRVLLARQLQLSQSRMAAKDTTIGGLPSVRLGTLPSPFVQSPASVQYVQKDGKDAAAKKDGGRAETVAAPSPRRSATTALTRPSGGGRMTLREKSLPYAPAYLQLSVVRRVELLGASMHHETVQCILQLALHYLHSTLAPVSAAQQQQQQVTGSTTSAARRVDAANRSALTNTSTPSGGGKGSLAPRVWPEKERNPWTPMTQVFYDGRRWAVSDLQESDVLLFYVRFEFILEELPEAIEAVEGHLQWLHSQLQIQPTRRSQRRLVLNDFYMNVYPKIHFMLQYIQSQMGERAALQLLHDYDGGVLSSGNLLGVYEAVGTLCDA